MRILFPALAALALAGCAEQPALVSATAPTVVVNREADLTAKTELVCHKETPMGSQMIHTVCEAPQTDAERQANQRAMRDNNPPTYRAPGS
jgi:starvation-inducible outer membrane lipoprotein